MRNLIIITSLLYLSCSLDPVVIDPDTLSEYYLFCCIDPSYTEQIVLAGKAIPESMPEAVTNAKITLSCRDQTILLSHTHDGVYKNSINKFTVNPNDTCRLEMFIDSQMVASGAVQMPGPFEIIYPQPDDTITIEYPHSWPIDTTGRPKFKWQPSARALYYNIDLKLPHELYQGSFYSTFFTSTYVPEFYHSMDRADNEVCSDTTITVPLTIVAVDSTFRFIPNYGDLESMSPEFRKLEELYSFYLQDDHYTYNTKNNNLNGAKGVFNATNSCTVKFPLHVTYPDSMKKSGEFF